MIFNCFCWRERTGEVLFSVFSVIFSPSLLSKAIRLRNENTGLPLTTALFYFINQNIIVNKELIHREQGREKKEMNREVYE
jgi:hypothetical protein